MSDQTNDTLNQLDQDPAALTPEDDLEALKARANLLGLTFHPSISAPKLREKITAHLNAEANPAQPAGMPAATTVAQTKAAEQTFEDNPVSSAEPAPVASGAVTAIENTDDDSIKFAPAETDNQKRKRIRMEANRLVRIRVACMNPAKKEWQGEIFTTGNAAVGTLKKFVPFNVEEGWHVPKMILDMIQARQCQVFVTKKAKNGIKVREGKLIKEFNVEILPDLTEDELHDLAQRQAMAGGVSAE